MTIKELNAFIKEYFMHNKLRLAIMLSGNWGIGKSYYIENILIPYLSHFEISSIKISLYDLKDVSELYKQIYYESRLKLITKKDEKFFSGKIIIKGIISSLANFFNISPKISEDDLKELYSSVNLSNKLVILEDVERTDIDLSKLMGFVNNLTEQDNVKVLLVANENEILKPEIIYDSKKEKLIRHYSSLAEKYLRIKEKTISDTIIFPFNYQNSIKSIVKSFNNRTLTKLFKNESFIANIEEKLISNSHENLRTVIFSIQKTIDFLKIFSKNRIRVNDDILIKIINVIFDICIELKKGKLENEDLDIHSKIIKEYKNTDYEFCVNYILNQKIDTTIMVNSINNITEEENLCNNNKYDEDVEILVNFMRSDDVELIKAINNIETKINNNNLNFYNYGLLASYLIYVSDFLQINVDKIKKQMLINLKNANVTKSNNWFMTSIQQRNEEKTQEFNKFKEDIISLINNTKQESLGDTLNNKITQSREFCNFCYEKSNDFINEHRFFSFIDVAKFVITIQGANPSDITNYRYAMSSVYRFSNISDFFLEDIPNLVNVMNKLNDIKSNTKTKNLVLSWLISDINDYLIKLGYSNK